MTSSTPLAAPSAAPSADDNAYAHRDAPDTLRFERRLPGTPEHIWAYLTEPDKRRQWLADGSMDLMPGGLVELVFRNGELNGGVPTPERFAPYAGEIRNRGVVLICVPPRLLSFTWEAGSPDESEVTFLLEALPEPGHTRLTVIHRRLAKHTTMLNVASGWHSHLALLAAELAGAERPALWPLVARHHDAYAARLAD